MSPMSCVLMNIQSPVSCVLMNIQSPVSCVLMNHSSVLCVLMNIHVAHAHHYSCPRVVCAHEYSYCPYSSFNIHVPRVVSAYEYSCPPCRVCSWILKWHVLINTQSPVMCAHEYSYYLTHEYSVTRDVCS